MTPSAVRQSGNAERDALAVRIEDPMASMQGAGPPRPSVGRRVRLALWRRGPSLLGLASVLVLGLVWELASRAELVDPFFISRPSEIAAVGYEMFRTGEIYPHLWVSAKEAFLGFVAAVAVGIPAGLLIGRFGPLRAIAEPYIVAMYSTPTVAFLPLLILWLGIGLSSKVFLIFLGGVFMVLVNTSAGVLSVDPNRIETARSFMASEWRIFVEVILPSTVGYITAGIRLAIGRVLITMFVAELYVANAGVGFLITQAGMQFRTAELFVGIFILAGTGVALSQSLRWVEDHKLARFR